MGLQRGVTREEVVNIWVCNFLLSAVFEYCKNKTAGAYFPSVFFRASVFLLHLRLEESCGKDRKRYGIVSRVTTLTL